MKRMSKEAQARDTDQSDIEYIIQRQARESISFLNESDDWGLWTLCPMVLHTNSGWPTYGVVVAKGVGLPDNQHVVYECNMYELVTDLPLIDQLEKFPKHPFTSFATMVAAGWRVD